MSSHQQATRQQFDPQAQAYLTSAVHAAGPDLAAGTSVRITGSDGITLSVAP